MNNIRSWEIIFKSEAIFKALINFATQNKNSFANSSFNIRNLSKAMNSEVKLILPTKQFLFPKMPVKNPETYEPYDTNYIFLLDIDEKIEVS